VASGLKKPASNLYKTSLYLDGEAVLGTLSQIEEGAVDEVLTHILEGGSGGVGAEVGVPGAKLQGGKKRDRRFEEEIRRRRTEYAAAATLVRLLDERDAIGELGSSYGKAEHQELEEHMLLRLRGRIRVHPLHQALSAAKGWLAAAPSFGVSREDMVSVRETVNLLEALTLSSSGERSFLALAQPRNGDPDYRLVLPIQESKLRVPLDEFAGSATFIAQVDRILGSDEEILAVRLIRNAPQLPIERDGLLKAFPDLVAGIAELGIEATLGEFVLTSPTVILKPIWIFK
jgi:hypothetical protein